MKRNSPIFIRSDEIRIELDFTPDDDGIYLWNSDGFHDLSEIESLVSKLKASIVLIEENRKSNKGGED